MEKLNTLIIMRSHISSSLYFSNFNECINLSLDGFGDFSSSAWGTFKIIKI